MPASPVAIRDMASAARGLGHRAGEQRDRGAVGVAAEHAAAGEVAEHRGDRAVVLLGEHLGRREQRGLAAGVDDAEHGAQRDDGLAGADLALEQAVHRVRLREVVLDLARRPRAGRRSARTAAARRTRSSSGPAAGPGLGAQGTQRRAAAGEHDLGDQRLLEAEAAMADTDLLRSRRARAPRSKAVRASTTSYAVAHAVGEQLGHVVEDRPGEVDRPLHVPGLDALGLAGRSGRAPPKLSSIPPGWPRPPGAESQDDHLGVGQLPLLAEPC